jgi:hypothetical protein
MCNRWNWYGKRRICCTVAKIKLRMLPCSCHKESRCKSKTFWPKLKIDLNCIKKNFNKNYTPSLRFYLHLNATEVQWLRVSTTWHALHWLSYFVVTSLDLKICKWWVNWTFIKRSAAYVDRCWIVENRRCRSQPIRGLLIKINWADCWGDCFNFTKWWD